MSHPAVNVSGYADSNVMNHVSKFKGNLLLIHGLIDENVHFRHSSRLIQSLIENKKSYELLALPGERHGPQKYSNRYSVSINDSLKVIYEILPRIIGSSWRNAFYGSLNGIYQYLLMKVNT